METKENLTMQNVEEWRIAKEDAEKKRKKLKKRYKKLKNQKKNSSCLNKKKMKKLKRRLKETKRMLKDEKLKQKNCTEQMFQESNNAKFEIMYRDQNQEMMKNITRLQIENQYKNLFLDILLKEMMPEFLKKYGKKMAIDADYRVIEE